MTDIQRLVDRFPSLGPEALVARYRPPRRFAGVRFAGYVPNEHHPSQSEALAAMEAFAEAIAIDERRGPQSRWFRRRPLARREGACGEVAGDGGRPARYLDGGYGVGKTHLLASLWHEVDSRGLPAVYLSFGELTAVVGFLGMEEAIRSFSSFRLICVDEFELDDVANTLMAVTFLRGVVARGTRVATTSNSLPERLGEGRFTAEDFTREIAAIASHFETIRVDGPDYRRGQASPGRLLDEDRLDAVIAGSRTIPIGITSPQANGTLSLDSFDDLLDHLRRVHPVQFAPMLDGLDVVAVKGLHPIVNQGDALLFVQLIDELYEAEVTFLASGCPIDELFPASYRHGGYRKKYGRCESRLAALLAEAAAA